MLRTRKRWISLLVTLAMLVAFCLPAGTAFAADPVTFSNAVQKGIEDGTTTSLGWIKIDVDDAVPTSATFYVTVKLPDGVDFTGSVVNNESQFVEVKSRGSATPSITVKGTPDEDEYTVSVSESTYGVDYILLKFNGTNSRVNVESGFSNDIKVDVSVNAKDGTFDLWPAPYTASPVVGVLGDKEITVTADSPKALSAGSGKDLAKITIQENLPGALSASVPDVVYIELADTDYVRFEAVNTTVYGSYNLKANVVAIDDGKQLKVTITQPSTEFGDKIEITPKVTVYPGASGDVDVEVTCPTNGKFKDATLTLGTLGETDVTVTAKNDAEDIYPAMGAAVAPKIKDIKFEASAKFAAGDTFTLTLPEGFEWNTVPSAANISQKGNLFNSNRSVWYEIGSALNSDVFTLTGGKIKVAANAPIGDIEVTVTGDLGEHSVVVGECKARATFEAEKPNVVVGLGQVAGKVTITETEKDSLGNDTITLALPTGIKFTDKPKVEVNGDELATANVTFVDDNYDAININLAGLRNAKIDTITISDIKYDLDSRVAYGDIVVKVKGDAFNKLAVNEEVNDTDSSDAVATLVNAVVVSPTAGKATMKIGDPKIVINGVEKIMETAPYIKNQRTYVSVTYAALACGVAPENIMWDGVNRTVTVIKGDRIAQFKIGSNVMTLNGAVITMDTAPEIVNARTMMPVTWVALALGGNTGWDAATQTVTVTVN